MIWQQGPGYGIKLQLVAIITEHTKPNNLIISVLHIIQTQCQPTWRQNHVPSDGRLQWILCTRYKHPMHKCVTVPSYHQNFCGLKLVQLNKLIYMYQLWLCSHGKNFHISVHSEKYLASYVIFHNTDLYLST